jgi:hypothetical protein
MKALLAWRTMTVVLTLTVCGAAFAQARPSPSGGPTSAAPSIISAEILKGTWIRPDGGYRIVIRGIGTGGKLDATYFNPRQLPFAKAHVVQDPATFRVGFELQAGGYAGSTYDLRYEAATDRLVGTYYQAVAKQTFDVFFVRMP